MLNDGVACVGDAAVKLFVGTEAELFIVDDVRDRGLEWSAALALRLLELASEEAEESVMRDFSATGKYLWDPRMRASRYTVLAMSAVEDAS
jgi:hypothetical protein